MGKKQIIDSSSEGIVLHEIKINISDEKLKNMLSIAYEEAQQNANVFHFYNLWTVFLSISGTLLISLITSSFNSVFGIDSDTVRTFFVVLCISFAITSIVLLVHQCNTTIKNSSQERDEAVKRIAAQYIFEKTENG